MISLLIALSFLTFAARRILHYAQYFQQEEYDTSRFLPWIINTHSYDTRITGGLVILGVTQYFMPDHVIHLAIPPLFLWGAFMEVNPIKAGKKPLVLTSRVKRILAVTGVLTLGIAVFLYKTSWALIWILGVQALPILLALGNLLLTPYEKYTQSCLRAEAVQKLQELNPYVIAVTGSFGKTSVKHMLGHVMSNFGGTLITPGSVNTEMGIVRIIRERLEPTHKYFVVEMGAYGIGSIARLCRLTPPKLSLITAVGAAHLERFKTIEDTARAKFEIAEAAIQNGGQVLIQDSVLNSNYGGQFYKDHQSFFTTCGLEGDFQMVGNVQTPEGLETTVIYKGHEYLLKSPLYGLHHGSNVAITFGAAVMLGMNPKDVALSIQSIPQIKHRLEVKSFGDHTLIDDAFNSNPQGFQNALEILDLLGTHRKGRRILVTPGMVELGDKHDTEHHSLGTLAAQKADLMFVVKPERIPTFVEALRASGKGQDALRLVGSFGEANTWIQQNRLPNDVILLENDLPDLYEKKMRL